MKKTDKYMIKILKKLFTFNGLHSSALTFLFLQSQDFDFKKNKKNDPLKTNPNDFFLHHKNTMKTTTYLYNKNTYTYEKNDNNN